MKPDTCEPYNIRVYITWLLDLCIIKQALVTCVWFKIYIFIYWNEIKLLKPITSRYRLQTYSHINVSCSELQNSLFHFVITAPLPHTVKLQYLYFRSHAEYFLWSWKFPKVISRRSILYYNVQLYIQIQPFSMEVDWQEIWH